MGEGGADYFFLLDPSIRFTSQWWMGAALYSLYKLNNQMNNWGVSTINAGDPQTVFSPVFHKSHLEMFKSFREGEVFLPSLSFYLNKLLLVEAYNLSPVQSDSSTLFEKWSPPHYEAEYLIANDDVVSKGCNDYKEIGLEDLADYISQVQKLRVHILSYLAGKLFKHNPPTWTLSAVAYNEQDYFYYLYCSKLSGCEVNTSQQTSKIGGTSEISIRINNKHKIAFITAIFGTYESSCKPFHRQSVPSDFICFTDNSNMTSNGWEVDLFPYHLKSLKDDIRNNKSHLLNSINNNKHPFNIAKYYKTMFHEIPRLSQYDIIVWIDGNVQISNKFVSEMLMKKLGSDPMLFSHEERNGKLFNEASGSKFAGCKYNCIEWQGFTQPYQDIQFQYESYIADGYIDDGYWESFQNPFNKGHGVWVTSFIAYRMRFVEKNKRNERIINFLISWNEEIKRFSTQDQVSFSYVAQKLSMNPYSLPDETIKGASNLNNFFVKTAHGS
jgi:hypothetical protein